MKVFIDMQGKNQAFLEIEEECRGDVELLHHMCSPAV
jgi:hypothetical protein